MISVIVPVYNVEKYIEKCILSILSQTYTEFELLLINDGSTDSSYEICKQWTQKDPRIKVFSQNNCGVSAARNKGLDQAQGEYICFIDADDWIDKTFFEKMLSKMTEGIDVVITDFQEITEDGEILFDPAKHISYEGNRSSKETISDAYHSLLYTRIVWGRLYKKAVWDNVRFKPLAYSEDTLAMFEILCHIQTIYLLNEPLYFYLQRNSSVIHQLKISHYENAATTISFMYNKAVECYPDFVPCITKTRLAHDHLLLKIYAQANHKKKAFELIEKMQLLYKTSLIKKPAFADRLLVLPKYCVYLYAKLKGLLQN